MIYLKNRNRQQSLKGFTLIEVMMALAILAFCLTGMLLTYIGLLALSETSRNLSLAVNVAQTKVEELRNQPFDSLVNFNGTTFDVPGFAAGSAKGRIEVTDTDYADLKQVRIVSCWRQRGGRLIGEDVNLNGVLNDGEDQNGNNILDSPSEVISFIAR
ncbi:MAG: prepilin-type N-terminal cleavage/methylation domain-containing protein [Candidatus Omnitrophota bacterium]